MVWGQIAGAVIGGVMSQRAAKKQANAINAANAMSNQGYTDARPYITDMMSRGQAALNSQLATGPYTGATYAQLDPLQTAAYNNMGNLSGAAFNNAQGFMNTGQGFAQNYANLYNQASQNALNNAVNYASDPPSTDRWRMQLCEMHGVILKRTHYAGLMSQHQQVAMQIVQGPV